MKLQLRRFAIPGLRYTMGVVVLLESVHFALSPSTAHQLTRMGLPPWIGPALGGTEALAALIFLPPGISMVGGYALLFVLAVAAAIHLIHGELDVGGLAVYAMAVIVCIAHHNTDGHD